MYNGKKDKSYLQTRIRLHISIKKRILSLCLPPDPDLLLQALKRAQLQTLVWCQCNMAQIKRFNPELYGCEYGLRIKSNFLYGLLVHSYLLLCVRAIEKGKILHLLTEISHMDGGDEVSEVEKVNYGEKDIVV